MPTPTFTGASFQTNLNSPFDNQSYAAVAALSDGRFAAVYRSDDLGAGSLRVVIRNADGSLSKSEITVDPANEDFIDGDNVAIAALKGGGFVMTWAERGATDSNIKHRVFNAEGKAVSAVLHSNSDATDGVATRPDVVGDGQGGFYIVWDDTGFDSEPGPGETFTPTVRIRHYDASGVPTAGSQMIADEWGVDSNPAIAISRDGERLNIIWDDDLGQSEETNNHDSIRGLEMGGSRGAYRVDGGMYSEFHTDPDVAYSSGDNFMAVWSEFIAPGVYAVHGSINGGAEFKINTSAHQHWGVVPKVVGLASGDFLVVWYDGGLDGNDDVLGQLFNVSGTKIGGEFEISDRVSSDISRVEAKETLDGRVVVTWDSTPGPAAKEIYSRFVDVRQAAVNWTGTATNEQFVGTAFGDVLNGSGGHDIIDGGGGVDTIIGGAGNDTLTGGAGADTLRGDAGNDIYVLENGADNIIDISGIDTVTSTITRSLALSSYLEIENLTLLGNALNGTGNNLANVITGNALSNALTGNGGNDT
ncbi:MAG TPA: hypothetical protein VMF90_20990, partial [Rhizobiaceae bacterium]|nr:hypothetical protein [Rhizobiaceae bacterium]